MKQLFVCLIAAVFCGSGAMAQVAESHTAMTAPLLLCLPVNPRAWSGSTDLAAHLADSQRFRL